MTKIKTNCKAYPLLVAILCLLSVIIPALTPNTNWRDLNTVTFFLFISAGFLFFALDAFFGIYVTYNDEYICKTTEFIIKQKVYFADIREVFYLPVWIVDDGSRVISLVSMKNGHRKVTRLMTNRFYSAADVNKVWALLKSKAPEAKFYKKKQV